MLTTIAQTGTQPYLWLPGFGFDWRIFAKAIDQRPGLHYSITWPQHGDFTSFCQHLSQQVSAHWQVIGWSLGGAIAAQIHQPGRSTKVLACQTQFCHDQRVSRAALRAFIAQLKRCPEQAMQRFCQWSGLPQATTIKDVEALVNTAQWLNQYHIANWSDMERLYGRDDPLVWPDMAAQVVDGNHASVLEYL